jgi:Fe-S-cluster containining protein
LYLNVKDYEVITFSNCDSCTNSCCQSDKFVMAPLVLEDVEEVYQNFAVLFGVIGEEIKLLMILNDGRSACRFLDSKGQCSIYDNRPPACQLYPFTPFNDQLLVDSSCDGVAKEGSEIYSKHNGVNKTFYHQRLENFEAKRKKTMEFILEHTKSLQFLKTIKGIPLFYSTKRTENNYLLMHQNSLHHLLQLK